MFENVIDRDCLQTLNRALGAIPEDQDCLDVITLMSALYDDGQLRRRWPRLAALLPPLSSRVRAVNGPRIGLAEPLTDLFTSLQQSPGAPGGPPLSRKPCSTPSSAAVSGTMPSICSAVNRPFRGSGRRAASISSGSAWRNGLAIC